MTKKSFIVGLSAAFAVFAGVAGYTYLKSSGQASLDSISSTVGIDGVGKINSHSEPDKVSESAQLAVLVSILSLSSGSFQFKDDRLTAWVGSGPEGKDFPRDDTGIVTVIDFNERGLICLSGDTLDPKKFECFSMRDLNESDATSIIGLGCMVGDATKNPAYAHKYCMAYLRLLKKMERPGIQVSIPSSLKPA